MKNFLIFSINAILFICLILNVLSYGQEISIPSSHFISSSYIYFKDCECEGYADINQLTSLYSYLSSFPKGYNIQVIPTWWIKFDETLKEVSAKFNMYPKPMEQLINDPDCQEKIIEKMILQNHGQAILDGIDLQNSDIQKSDEKFVLAVRELAIFVQSLYCLDIKGIKFWDRAISEFWIAIENAPLSDFDFSQAIAATWNPALLVLDFIQFTGESEIINTFKKLEPKIKKALDAYPIETYGAAWLDEFGSGRLVRVNGQMAHDNLVGVFTNPERLGLGLSSLLEHATTNWPNRFSFAGFKPQICGNVGADGIFDFLLNLGLSSLEINEYPIKSGGWGINVTRHSPESFFGKNIDELFNPESQLMSNFCSNKGGGLGIGKWKNSSCFHAAIMAKLGKTPTSKILKCTNKYSTVGKPYVEPPIQVDWDKFLQCASTDPLETSKKTLPPPETRTKKQKKLDKEVDKMRKDAKKKGPDAGHSKAKAKVDNAKVHGKNKNDTIGWNKLKQEKLVTDETAGYADVENNEIYLNPALSDAEKEETLFHESLHIYFDARGVSPYEDLVIAGVAINTLHHAYMMMNGWYRPTPDSPNSGICRESAAAKRARLIFDCLFSEQVIEEAETLGPRIYPLDPKGKDIGCDEVDVNAFWRSSTQGGATDPSPLDNPKRKGGPMIAKTFVPNIHGVIDPPKPFIPVTHELLKTGSPYKKNDN